jgi:hypothetical protein
MSDTHRTRFECADPILTCVSEPGEPCLHESFLFAVGATGSGAVELDVYQSDGRLSIVRVSGFTSWKRVRDADRITGRQALHRFNETVLIDCITREEHCLTVRCWGIVLIFFGRNIALETEQIAEVAPPHLFGEGPGREYRQKYAKYFTDHRKPST